MADTIGAIILAAGQSTRMGVSKMLLPWNQTTVIETVVQLAITAQLTPIITVTGAFLEPIHVKINAFHGQIEEVHNPLFAEREMFYSLKLALQKLQGRCVAALIFLGDQPQIPPEIVTGIIERYHDTKAGIVLPSYHMRRGHPILVHEGFFHEILSMPDSGNLKDFMKMHSDSIDYLVVDTGEVLEDIDSPDDYERIKKNHTH